MTKWSCLKRKQGATKSAISGRREKMSPSNLCCQHQLSSQLCVYTLKRLWNQNPKIKIKINSVSVTWQMYKLSLCILLVAQIAAEPPLGFLEQDLLCYFQHKSARYCYKCVEMCWRGSQVEFSHVEVLVWEMWGENKSISPGLCVTVVHSVNSFLFPVLLMWKYEEKNNVHVSVNSDK